ncbi:MAG: AIM24 family protein, partial [Deltaproteobacteria bacterium]|nr:AIM24 family protein [Deltaproteobacteria bacterium]
GHLVAWPDYMSYSIEKASNGWINSWMSGESLVCRFTGPGNILIQTRNPQSFKGWLATLGVAAR